MLQPVFFKLAMLCHVSWCQHLYFVEDNCLGLRGYSSLCQALLASGLCNSALELFFVQIAVLGFLQSKESGDMCWNYDGPWGCLWMNCMPIHK